MGIRGSARQEGNTRFMCFYLLPDFSPAPQRLRRWGTRHGLGSRPTDKGEQGQAARGFQPPQPRQAARASERREGGSTPPRGTKTTTGQTETSFCIVFVLGFRPCGMSHGRGAASEPPQYCMLLMQRILLCFCFPLFAARRGGAFDTASAPDARMRRGKNSPPNVGSTPTAGTRRWGRRASLGLVLGIRGILGRMGLLRLG